MKSSDGSGSLCADGLERPFLGGISGERSTGCRRRCGEWTNFRIIVKIIPAFREPNSTTEKSTYCVEQEGVLPLVIPCLLGLLRHPFHARFMGC